MSSFLKYRVIFLASLLTSASILNAHVLDLDEAIRRSWVYSPTASIANSEVEIRKAEEYQVSLLPNPQFSVELDGADCCFKGGRGNNNDQEITYSLSQLIELGGKRSSRKRIALFQSSLAAYDAESVKLDLRNEVTKAFVDVMAAQEFVKLAEEQKRIAFEVHSTTSAKVEGGKISSLQETKANLARATAELALEKALRAFTLAKKKLAGLWGATDMDFSEVAFPLYEITPLDALEALLVDQSKNLEMTKWKLQIALAENIVANEKAQRIPDVIVTAGYYNCQGDDDGLLLGLTLPIPIFDRNQGNICRAQQQLNQLYEMQNEDKIQLRLDLEEAYDELLTAYNQGLSFKNTILASAKTAFEAAVIEYNNGKNDYLELLDAQRTLFEIQEQYISTLVDYHHKKADVIRIVGLPINPICIDQNF